MSILVVGGDSADAITQLAHVGGHGCVDHWSGGKTRDLTKSIPKGTKAVVVVLDRVNHTLARKVRKRRAGGFPCSSRKGTPG
jgi:hypothetical protein